jgi:prophage regulatory protein
MANSPRYNRFAQNQLPSLDSTSLLPPGQAKQPSLEPTSFIFLRLPQVMQCTGLSRSAIYAMVAAGDFPSPIRLGARAVGWTSTSLQSWMSERVNASRRVPSTG